MLAQFPFKSAVFLYLLGAALFPKVTALRCQESSCTALKDPKLDCLTRYNASNRGCGPAQNVCSKTLVYDSTDKELHVEVIGRNMAMRYPVISVVRKCDSNWKGFPLDKCIDAPHASPPNNAIICLCNTDYCNTALKPSKSFSVVVALVIIALYTQRH